jgi:Fe2+ transport system protein B
MIREIGRKYALTFLAGSFVIAWVLAFIIYHLSKAV